MRGGRAAFTLLEVMIAVALFFMAAFAVLSLVSQNLSAARRLQKIQVTAASLAAQATLVNQVVEGAGSGDFGELHPGFTWQSETNLMGTNGLFQVDFAVMSDGRVDSTMTILLYRPNSQMTPGGGSRRLR
jgi:type II secretion system protein I